MPPRASATVSNSVFNVASLLQSLPQTSRSQAFTKCSACLFSTSTPLQAKRAKKHKGVRRHIDPYRVAQALQRKSANLARQKDLQAERQTALGDPIRSQPTPFVDSLHSSAVTDDVKKAYLNYFLKPEDVNKSVEHSKWLSEPLPGPMLDVDAEENFARKVEAHAISHENASKAVAAIAALNNASSKDLIRINVQRCIEEFGRHNTDSTLPAKLRSKSTPTVEPRKRVGPDTGSSEVQIGVLTTKINVLADNVHMQDKTNRRNLRLLVHKRQKLLKYLRREDRGGPRWQNIVEKLGISDAMWKGEITLPR